MTRTRELSTLGERLRFARKRAGFSHDRLAAVVGTSRQHLIRLEKNIHAPRPEMLARIAEALGCSVEELRGSSDEDDEESDPVADLVKSIRALVRDELNSNEPSVSRQEQPLGSSTKGS